MVVIAAGFPEARLVCGGKFNSAQPFGAFPEIKMRHNEPHGPAMLHCEGRPLSARRLNRIFRQEVRDRHIGGVPIIAEQVNELGLWL